MCKQGEEEQKPTTLHIRSTRTFYESDQEVVESVYSISERLQAVEETERVHGMQLCRCAVVPLWRCAVLRCARSPFFVFFVARVVVCFWFLNFVLFGAVLVLSQHCPRCHAVTLSCECRRSSGKASCS